MARRIELYEVEGGKPLGAIDDAELRRLVDLLEEESDEDQDYWIDQPTIDLLAAQGLEPGLVARLREALGDREGFDLGWRE